MQEETAFGELIALQEKAVEAKDKIARLQMLYAKTQHPSIAQVINLYEKKMHSIAFPETPQFTVPELENFNGDVLVGTSVMNANNKSSELLIKIDSQQHSMICGTSGCGKTYAMLLQRHFLIETGYSTILFAVEGNEASLIQDDKTLFLDCNSNGNFRFNPLTEIKGATIDESVDDLCQALGVLWLGIKSYGFLKPILTNIFHEKRNGKAVTIQDLYEEIKQVKYSEARENLLNRLMLIKDAELFNTAKDANIELISKTNIVFCMEALNIHSQIIFINLLTAMLMRYKRVSKEYEDE